MKTTPVLLFLATALGVAPASAVEPAHFQILEVTFQGFCGSVDPVLSTLASNPAINFVIPDLSVSADDRTTQARKLCNVRLHVKADPGYRLGLGEVYYQGKVDIDPSGGSGNVSARAFFLGLRGIDAFKRFGAGDSGEFTVDVDEGIPGYSECGGETYLNLLVDITARTRPGNGQYAEVTIQSEVATPIDRSVIRCGIKQDRCF
jgi:hypothetical protein